MFRPGLPVRVLCCKASKNACELIHAAKLVTFLLLANKKNLQVAGLQVYTSNYKSCTSFCTSLYKFWGTYFTC